jgi:hypothetical protein
LLQDTILLMIVSWIHEHKIWFVIVKMDILEHDVIFVLIISSVILRRKVVLVRNVNVMIMLIWVLAEIVMAKRASVFDACMKLMVIIVSIVEMDFMEMLLSRVVAHVIAISWVQIMPQAIVIVILANVHAWKMLLASVVISVPTIIGRLLVVRAVNRVAVILSDRKMINAILMMVNVNAKRVLAVVNAINVKLTTGVILT